MISWLTENTITLENHVNTPFGAAYRGFPGFFEPKVLHSPEVMLLGHVELQGRYIEYL